MDASAAVATLQRQGFVHVPSVFGPEEVQALRRQMDALFDDPALQGREDPELHDSQYVQKGGMLLRNTISLAPSFLNLLTHPVLLALGEAALGPNCRFCGQNGLRSARGMAIDTFHVDCPVIFPLPERTPRHEHPPPLLWLTVQIALSDIDSIEHGPTQYVPCSHMSGRYPPRDTPHPSFEGQGPVSMLCKAGDVYVQNPNCWHRGAPNTSDRTRYLFQTQYAVDWAFRRFGWMNRVPVPDSELRRADDSLLEVLGVRRPAAAL